MKFSGRLQIEADPRNWLKTELTLNQARVELVSGGELLGSWSTAQVKAERLEGDRFQLQLGGDRAVFAADDALAFSYEAQPALSKKSVIAVATGLRGKLRKGLTGTDPIAEPPAEPDSAVDVPERLHEDLVEASQTPQPTRRLRELIQEAVKSNAAEVAAHESNPAWGREPAPPTAPAVEHPVQKEEIYIELERPDPVWQQEPASSDSAPEPLAEMPAFLTEEPADLTGGGPSPSASIGGGPSPSASIGGGPSPTASDPTHLAGPRRLAQRRQFGLGESHRDPPVIGLDSISADAATPIEPKELEGPSRGIFAPEETAFKNGDTLGERPAEPFGWIPAAPAQAAEIEAPVPSTRLTRSLETLIEAVRNSEMSKEQIIAVTDLVRGVADAIEDKESGWGGTPAS